MATLDLAAWTTALEEAIADLVGIRLDAHAGRWEAAGDALVLLDDAGEVLRLGPLEGLGPEDAHELLPDEDDLRTSLAEARRALLERRLEAPLRARLAAALGEEGWDLEVLDAGHWPSHHGMVEAEYLRDYPQFVAEVRLEDEHPRAQDDPDEDVLELRLDPYQEPFHDPVELEELLEARGWA